MKKGVTKFLSISDAALEWSGKILSYTEVVMLACLLLEVICRYFFNSPTHWTSAFCLYLFGASGVMAGGWVLKRDKNIRVDIFYTLYPKRVQAAADIITCIFVFFWGYLITHYGWIKFINAVRRQEMSFSSWSIPMWPIRLTIPIGGAILLFAAFCKLIRSVYSVTTGGDL